MQAEGPPLGPSRLIPLVPSKGTQLKGFPSNEITTSKYPLLTFIPLNLFEQFHRLANAYFLALVALNWVPQLNVFGKEISMIPLLFVLTATALKDLLEDYSRHRSDNEINERRALQIKNGEEIEKKWREVKIGDVLKVRLGEAIPADLVILRTSFPDQTCFVSTMNLDGETNLKVRKSAQTQGQSKRVPVDENWDPTLEDVVCESPNENIYKFNGYMTRKARDGSNLSPIPLDVENLLLRDCILRNTEWVLGVAVYTGKETKSMLNNSRAPSKRSRIEKLMNYMVFWLFVLLLVICIICGVASSLWLTVSPEPLVIIILGQVEENPLLVGILNFLSSIILFQILIPIAVYITVDIVNLIQIYFINNDIRLYHEETKTKMSCRAFNIHSDLGQVHYLFTDKTGTLTCNRQVFSKCSVNGRVLRSADLIDQLSLPTLRSASMELETNPNESFHYFLLTMCMCNTVTIDRLNPGTAEAPNYQSEFPDEVALAKAAATSGYVLLSRSPEFITLSVHGKEQRFQIISVLPFTSDRKRMSILLRDEENNTILFLTKGADEVIFKRLQNIDDEAYQSFLAATQKHLNDFSELGLRTLCLGYRIWEEKELEWWMVRYDEASGELEKRQNMLELLYDEFERNFILLGVTGVEDKLQDNVPDTLATLFEAGISIWVLTGDMQNTAINVATSCNLLNNQMEKVIMSSESPKECSDMIDSKMKEMSENSNRKYSLVIHGKSLVQVLKPGIDKQFFEFVSKCQVVICCRVSPLQKALVVQLVRKYTDKITMAIGDGANDVAMIQAAHVGVGLSGQEGRQAVMSSDFALAQFRFLKELILVHGHWSYYRLSLLILYYLYKNAVFVMILFWYQIYCAYSNQTPIDDLDLILYGLLYVTLPVCFHAVIDQDVARQILLENPVLASIGQLDKLFNQKVFFWNMLDMLYQSVAMTFIPIYIYISTDANLYQLGVPILTSCLLVAALHLALETNSWTWIHWLAYVLNVVLFFPIGILFDAVPGSENYRQLLEGLTDPLFYLVVALTTVAALLPRYTARVYLAFFHFDALTHAKLLSSQLRKRRKTSSLQGFHQHDTARADFNERTPLLGRESFNED